MANSPASTRRVYMFEVYGSKHSLLPRICDVDAVGMGATRSEFRTPLAAIFERTPRSSAKMSQPAILRHKTAIPLGRLRSYVVGALLPCQVGGGFRQRASRRWLPSSPSLNSRSAASEAKAEVALVEGFLRDP